MGVITKLTNAVRGLPDWVRKVGKDSYEWDPAVVYPLYLKRLGMETTQYSLEVARRCATQDLRLAHGGPFRQRILRRPHWALANHPPGLGAEAGAAGFRVYWEALQSQG